MTDTDGPVVLVVEDEPDVAETYDLWLAGDYEVRHATDGQSALEMMDDDVDVVLLDRMMPGMSGDEVLGALREQGYTCGVAMVTAVDPDFDLVEMGMDDYVTKPPTREGLREIVATLLDRKDQTGEVRRYHRLVSKRAAIETEKPPGELDDSEEYRELVDEIERLEAEMDETEYLDDAAFVASLRELDGGEPE
jgi:two-component system response regulator AdeR